MASEPLALSTETVALFESGVSVLIGTCDAERRPAAVRAIGLKVTNEARTLVVYVADATASTTAANARTTKRIAVNVTRPIDYRSFQIKGAVLDVRAARDDERALLEKYVVDYAGHVEKVGLPRALSEKLAFWPATAIELSVETMFVQTPGPAAGNLLPRGA